MNGVREQRIALLDKRYQESMIRLGRKAARDDPSPDLANMIPSATQAQVKLFKLAGPSVRLQLQAVAT